MNYLILIPVYNAFKESLDCLNSVITHTSSEIPIVIIDDGSPKGEFVEFAKGKYSSKANVVFKRATSNGGYVKASNFGLKNGELILENQDYEITYKDSYDSNPEYDIILLNSDTLVTKGWDKSLKKAAYSADKITSVTPYSNNAILASFPRFCRVNTPTKDQIDSIAEKIQKYSIPVYPELPTAMGFCNYIRRDALNVIGYYDEDNFGLGNGEENDFSLRARALGYTCILDDTNYVYHKGEVSFAESKRELEEKNGETIRKMYPHYMDEISKYCSSDPNRANRNDLLDKIFINEAGKPTILHLVHNTVNYSKYFDLLGGTEIHTYSLIEELKEYNHACLVRYKNYYHLTIFYSSLEREFYLPNSKYGLSDIINSGFFNLVHLQHSSNFDRDELSNALKEHGNYLTSLHDFNMQCPRNILIKPDKKLCNKFECSSACGFSNDFIENFRKSGLEIINKSRKVIAFSNSTLKVTEEISGNKILNSTIIKHSSIEQDEKINYRTIDSSIDVLILGVLVEHKGLKIIKDILKSDSNINIKFHLLGKIEEEILNTNFVNHGTYSKETLKSKILAINPHIVFIPSLCYETYSLTLDEALSFGIPALVGPNGAPKERVCEQNVGWVLDTLDTNLIIDTINSIANNESGYRDKFENAKNYSLMNIQEERNLYVTLYNTYLKDIKIADNKQLISFFNLNAHLYEEEGSRIIKLLGLVANRVIFILDAIGLRGIVQKYVFLFFPKRLLYRIKASRI